MCSCHSISECCVMFSGVKLSMGSFFYIWVTIFFTIVASIINIIISKAKIAVLLSMLSKREKSVLLYDLQELVHRVVIT